MTGYQTKQCLLAGAAVVALVLAGTKPSQATLMISLADNLGNSASVTDQGAGDVNPALGAATFVGSVGNFFINVTTGLSKPILGSATLPDIDLSSVDVTSALGGTLTLEVTDTDFIGNAGVADFVSAIGGTQGSGGSLSYSTFADCSNSAFGTGIALSSQSFSGGGAFSGSSTTPTSLCSGNYSLTELVSLSLPGGFNGTSFDANLAVPEPATLALFGAGLLALPFVTRRKRVV